jgi:very-short-patch-repair endonuclease
MYRDHNQRQFARALRNQPTDAERRLWQFLRAQQLRGRKFRRQSAIGPYVVDFVCFADKLIVELDGPQHLDSTAVEHDKRRTKWLTARISRRSLPESRAGRKLSRSCGCDLVGD